MPNASFSSNAQSEPDGARSAPISALSELTLGHDRTLLDVLDAAVCVIDESGIITYATSRAAAILQAPRRDLAGSHIGSVLAPLEELRRARPSEPSEESRQKATLPNHPGTVVGYRTAGIRDEHGQESLAVVFQDITAWERLRDERDRLMRLAAVSEVLPAILHELKNPLAAIGTAVELLVEESTDNALRHDLHSVLTEIRRMSLTLEGVGSVGRELRAHKYSAVDHAIIQTATVLTHQASERGISIQCNIPALPLLPFDIAMVRAILFNLVTNSIHACKPGDTITLTAELKDGGAALQITVQDTGHGMPPDVIARCRELFYTTKPRGTGIGLALCERAISSAGGTLVINSSVGEGTQIQMTIPAHRPQVAKFGAGAARVSGNARRKSEGGIDGTSQ